MRETCPDIFDFLRGYRKDTDFCHRIVVVELLTLSGTSDQLVVHPEDGFCRIFHDLPLYRWRQWNSEALLQAGQAVEGKPGPILQ